MPALLNRMSIRPCVSTAVWISASTSFCFDTSQRTASAVGPRSRARVRPPSSPISARTTWAPSRAKRRAVAAPMPEAAPVITATLFSNRLRLIGKPPRSGEDCAGRDFAGPILTPRGNRICDLLPGGQGLGEEVDVEILLAPELQNLHTLRAGRVAVGLVGRQIGRAHV